MSELVAESNAVVQQLNSLEEDDYASLEQLLMTGGTDKEWSFALKMNDFGVIDALLDKVVCGSGAGEGTGVASSSSSSSSSSKEAVTIFKCLALSCNILPTLWQQHSNLHGIHNILRLTDTVVSLITCTIDLKLASSPKKVRPNSTPYAGFDVRDIADYNVNYNEEDPTLDEDEQLQDQKLQQLDDSLQVYLLVLCQLYACSLPSLSHILQYESENSHQSSEIATNNHSNSRSTSTTTTTTTTATTMDDEEDNVNIGVGTRCLAWCKDILECCHKVDEVHFLQALKFVSYVNFHFDTSEVSLKNQSSPISR